MLALVCSGALALAQAPAATMKQLMLDLVHPASNEVLLSVYRGEPQNETQWAAIRRSALTLAEAGNLLATRGGARDPGDWMADAKLLAEAGAAAYSAAQAKDTKALMAAAERIDAACTTCHKKFRPDVFPVQRGSK